MESLEELQSETQISKHYIRKSKQSEYLTDIVLALLISILNLTWPSKREEK